MDKSEWLASTIEEAIDPDEEIVDPHHHLWDFPTGTYLLPDLLDRVRVITSATVFVECSAEY